ncbi:MAG: hypothetical protein H0X30_17380 [Anaerolineae bacterium]|nr:hypothetical protein [Anaerolineae bacterium]
MDALRLKPIAFCGENPVMELYKPGTEIMTAAASYWHSTYSPHGQGNALLVYLDAANAAAHGQPKAAIYADNAPLARYLTDTFNQHFDGWKDLGFKEAPIYQARFFTDADTRQFYRVACHNQQAVIDVLWTDIRSSDFRSYSDLNDGGFGTAGDEHYHVSNAIFLCGQGHISINQRQAAGEAFTRTLPDERFSSSVFVALSETWVKLEQSTKN